MIRTISTTSVLLFATAATAQPPNQPDIQELLIESTAIVAKCIQDGRDPCTEVYPKLAEIKRRGYCVRDNKDGKGMWEPCKKPTLKEVVGKVESSILRCDKEQTPAACGEMKEQFEQAHRLGYCFGPENLPVSERKWGLCSEQSAPKIHYISLPDGELTLGNQPCKGGMDATFIENRRNGTGAFGCWTIKGGKISVLWTSLVSANGSVRKANMVMTYDIPPEMR